METLTEILTYHTGARRTSEEGRGRFDLLPARAIQSLAIWMEEGPKNGIDERNWEKGIPLSRWCSSTRRHLNDWAAGRGDHHLDAAFWNLACAIETRARIREGSLPYALLDFPVMPDVLQAPKGSGAGEAP